MYVPKNAGSNYRASLGDMDGIFSKIRNTIHKLIPRELSPTLMFKHTAAQKAKVKALETAVSETQRVAANDVAAANTNAQVAVLKAQNIPTPSPSFSLPSQLPAQFAPSPQFAPPTGAAPVQPEDNTTLYVGIGAAALLGAYLLTRGRK